MRSPSIRIQVGITTAFLFIILVLVVGLGVMVYQSAKSLLRDETQKRLSAVLKAAALALPEADLAALQFDSGSDSATYHKVLTDLLRIRTALSPDVRNVYTFRQHSGQIAFLVDGEPDPKERAGLGEIYGQPTLEMGQAAAAPVPETIFVERQPSADKWGTWLSGFIVIGNLKGGSAGVMGIDVAADALSQADARALAALPWLVLASAVTAALLGFWMSRRLSRPLRLIETDLKRLRALELDHPLELKSFFTEVRSMTETARDLKASLRSFRRYVPADLVAQLLEMHQEAVLGGERRTMTLFFSDIAGFTTWSEKLAPEVLISLMARYFDGMTSIILQTGGTVDKYIGDAVMAFWGAPVPLEDHGVRACRAALECQRFQHKLNVELEAEGFPPIQTRIGIHTGEVLVGNVGYAERLNYTVMGDAVNQASRLEGLNKLYGTRILLSEATRSALGTTFITRPIDLVIVKGKTEPVLVHELMATHDISERHRAYAQLSARAFRRYLDRDWGGSLQILDRLLSARPQDIAAQILAERCRQYIQADPGPGWEAAFHLREK